jgi:predicted esterase
MRTDYQQGSYHVETAGAAVEDARGVVIMIHGRGASPHDILSLAGLLGQTDLAYLAPAAPTGQWYPYRFTEPIARNEPGITQGMQAIDKLRDILAQAGIDADRTVLLGFSQGACLALEYAARHAQRFGGVVGLSGALIGPAATPRDYAGSLDGTPVFLGCSDVDPHIPLDRVREAAAVLERLGGEVTTRIYPGMPHTVNDDEIEHVRQLFAKLKPRE